MQEHLQRRCELWQDVLGLRDWKIDLHVVGMSKLSTPGDTLGECRPRWPDKTATILILEPDHALEQAEFFDPEHTLVHELLHIHLGFSNMMQPPSENEPHLIEEQAINAITTAFMRLTETRRVKVSE